MGNNAKRLNHFKSSQPDLYGDLDTDCKFFTVSLPTISNMILKYRMLGAVDRVLMQGPIICLIMT